MVTVGYAALTFAVFFPLFVAPANTIYDPAILGRLSLFALGDIYTVIWVMAWGVHALLTNPLGLYDANIFHPAPNVLTSTEHMLGHLPIFGPVYLLTDNPILANQVNLFVCLTLCGVSMYALLRSWGAAWPAAAVAGFVFAYCPLRIHVLMQVHLLAGQYFVLSILALDRFLHTGRRRWGVLFAGLFCIQSLCSFYLTYMSLVALAGYGVGILASGSRRPSVSRLTRLTVCGVLSLIPFLLLALPYLEGRAAGTLPLAQEKELLSFLSAKLHRLLLVREEGYYVGLSVALVGVIGAIAPQRSDGVPWARRGALLIAISCVAFAFGPSSGDGWTSLPTPYDVAARLIPGFSAMRGPIRFVLLAMVGFAALAGLGVDWLLRWLRWGTVGQLLLVLVAFAVIGLDYRLPERQFPARLAEVGPRVPAVYRALAELPAGPVLELPAGRAHDPGAQARESTYTLRSIYHWLPLLNGRSGYAPPSYEPVMALARSLPDPRSLVLLRRSTGLRYIVVHFQKLPRLTWAQWASVPGLKRVGRYGEAMLFEVEGTVEADLMPSLIESNPTASLLGAPLSPIAADGRRSNLVITRKPKVAPSRLLLPIEMVVENPTNHSWPSLTSVEEFRVRVGYRWRDRAGAIVSEEVDADWIPYDLHPGESAAVRLAVRVSVPPGDYRLELGVTQGESWFDGILDVGEIRVISMTKQGSVELKDSLKERLR